jgi:hypothetical protein
MSKYIDIELAGTSPTGKTKIWHVTNNHPNHAADQLGIVRWHGPWRKYVFEQPDGAFYDWECLRKIADFIEVATREHYGK